MTPRLVVLLVASAACSDYELNKGTDHAEAEDTAAVCALEAATSAVGTDESCKVDPVVGTFTPVVEWQWAANPVYAGFDDIMASPSVGNINDDNGDGRVDTADVPDVLFASFAGGAYTSAGTLNAISGDNGATHWSAYDPGGYHIYSSSGVAIGDIDADGAPDICVAGVEAAVVCLNGDGSFKWAGGAQPYGYGCPAFHDLDGDGLSEVIFGSQALDSAGNLLWHGGGGTGWYMSFAADIDQDGYQEVITGNTVYNWDGAIRWTDGTVDSPPALGDFDLDGIPEIVHSYASVTLTGADGLVRWSTPVPGGGGGPPTVADFDNDGYPEIGVAGAYFYSVIDTDGAVLWSAPVQDYSSSVTGSAVFDFEGDGSADVVYADEITLWVYDGATGAVKIQVDDHASGTLYEYPLIVDVDNDGSTEIVLASNNYAYGGWNGITVIGDAADSWRPSRPIWNQYAYSITNIEDDGSIPARPAPNWERYNNFRTGGTTLGLGYELPDLTPGPPDVCDIECGNNVVELVVPVANTGLATTPDFDVRIVPSGGGTPLFTETVPGLSPGVIHEVGPYRIERRDWSGSLAFKVDQPEAVEECDETDNVVELGEWPCPE